MQRRVTVLPCVELRGRVSRLVCEQTAAPANDDTSLSAALFVETVGVCCLQPRYLVVGSGAPAAGSAALSAA